MTTECTQVGFEFHSLNHRQIRAQFDGGAISSDGGGLLLREVDKRTGIIHKFAACFTDYRDPERIDTMARKLGLKSPDAGQIIRLDTATPEQSAPVLASVTPVWVVSAR